MDDLKVCDRCGSDACYIQEVNESIKNYQCYGCGFITNSLLVKDTQFFEEQMELLPNLYKELMGEDDDGKIWMPSTVNMPTKGMIFANGKNVENWKWAAVLAVPVKEEEKEKYPIPNKKGEYYEWRMDMENMKEFPETDYIEALDFIGIFNPENQ
tara:strand:- start:1458 stop:1922 length:465 start_codon:yes stop_codon:yes gene_type:complete